MRKYDIPLSNYFQMNLGKYPKIPLSKFVNEKNKLKCNDDALDLLEKMLTYDKKNRITAKEALVHPYFAPIRDSFEFAYY